MAGVSSGQLPGDPTAPPYSLEVDGVRRKGNASEGEVTEIPPAAGPPSTASSKDTQMRRFPQSPSRTFAGDEAERAFFGFMPPADDDTSSLERCRASSVRRLLRTIMSLTPSDWVTQIWWQEQTFLISHISQV